MNHWPRTTLLPRLVLVFSETFLCMFSAWMTSPAPPHMLTSVQVCRCWSVWMWWPVCRCVGVEVFECGDLCAGVWVLKGLNVVICVQVCGGWVLKHLNVIFCVQVLGVEMFECGDRSSMCGCWVLKRLNVMIFCVQVCGCWSVWMWWSLCRCVGVHVFECDDACAGMWMLGVEVFDDAVDRSADVGWRRVWRSRGSLPQLQPLLHRHLLGQLGPWWWRESCGWARATGQEGVWKWHQICESEVECAPMQLYMLCRIKYVSQRLRRLLL